MKSFKELILFFSVVLISSFGIKAQEVISTQGASYFNAYVKWDFTIGETVIFTGSSANNIITQGFHQPLLQFYADADGDGYGNLISFVWASIAPVGYVSDNTDCNDANAAVHPGATEVCNGIDDDCDTQIDEGVGSTFYADVDGDTYGNASSSVQGCTAAVGYVSNSTDCDDANAAVNPGAAEVCNGIDDDCDTQIDEGAPLANAGGAATSCGGSYSVYNLLDQNATGSGGTASWSSTGNGWFQYLTGSGPYTDLSPLYHVGSTDLSSGSVTLTLTVTGANGCVATSSFVLTLVAPPVAVIDPSVVNPWDELHVCAGGSYSFSNAVVSPGADIYWSGGDGSFNSDNIQNPIYTPGPQDISNGNVYIHLNVMSFDGTTFCDNMVDINLVIDPAPAMPTLACYETASFNPASCVWDVTPTGGITTYFADVDGDGFGDASNSLPGYTCLGAQAGYVTDATDCNDNSSAVNPGASETCNLIDDDCDGTADDGIAINTYYNDVDGDGFGAGLGTATCSVLSAPYVTNNTDCDDNNIAINPGAVEICLNAIDDDCDGVVNDGCLPDQLLGESPATAQYVWTNFFPSCVTQSHTLAGSSPSSASQSICLTGEDKWHYFTATSEAVSIVVASSANNILLELQSNTGVLLATENAVSGLGGEILNFSGLTAGQIYKVGVRNYNSDLGIGAYTICVKMLKRGGCDYGPGPYTLCQYFKATYAGTGAVYTFTFTGTSGSATGNVYTRSQSSDICILSNVSPSLPYGSTYSVLITSTYTLLDGAGNQEVIAVPGLSPCTMSTVTQPATSLRTFDQCMNGTRFRGSVVASLPWVCGVTNWRWEFTEVNPLTYATVGLPIALNRGAASNYLNLGTVAALQNGKTYAVRTAPILASTGSDYQWGTIKYMCIIGSAGMIVEDNNTPAADTKSEIANEVNMNVYPNPTHGTDVNINLSGITSDNVQIRVVDAMGRQVWSNRYSVDGILNTNITFERPLANGLYFVEAIYNGELQTQRMMVQK